MSSVRIGEEELLSRESSITSTTSVYKEFILGLEVLGDKDYLDGESLSDGFERIYGFNIDNKIIPQEIKMLTKNKEIFHLISNMKVYHTNGLSLEFDVNKITLRKVQGILIRRRLLASLKWTGRAKRTFGMILYLTKDCAKEDIENYMRQYIDIDSLRKDFEEKNKKPGKKTPKEIVEHNKEVRRLSNISEVPPEEVVSKSEYKLLPKGSFKRKNGYHVLE